MQQFAADRIQFILDGAVHLESFHLQTQTAQYGRIDALFQMNFLAGQTAQFRGQLGLLCGIERNGDYIVAIDSDSDLDEFATVNHYTEEGTTYVAL